jgi:aldehyde dehydrogenase (NAD+)
MSKLSDAADGRQDWLANYLENSALNTADWRCVGLALALSANRQLWFDWTISDMCPPNRGAEATMALLADGESSLLIDGKLTSGSAGTFPTINPATEEVLGTAADANAEDMGRAIEAARRAFDETDWSHNTELRVRCVRQLRDALRAHVEELRELTISEVGAPRMLTSSAQLEGPIDDLAFSADTAESYPWNQDLGEASPMGIATRRTIAREAVGVVGAITPWNFPHQINLAKLGPALAAGNTIVLKPAPDTPWCAAALGEIVVEHTDFPPGVINIVTSSDHGVGALVAKDPRVDMISFTGSTATGRSVMVDAAATIKKVFLELGGKSAFGVYACRSGLRDHHPAGGAACPLRRGGRHRCRDHVVDQAR